MLIRSRQAYGQQRNTAIKRSTAYQYPGFTLLLTTILAGCASNVPQQIRDEPSLNITPSQVQHAAESYTGKTIRWGGAIIEIQNRKTETRLTILAQALGRYGEPIEGDESLGRFIAIIPRFLDPAIYAKQRTITIYGDIHQVVTEKIDDFTYHYPLITVRQHYLWPARQAEEEFYPYYWYDPWYPYYHPYHYH